MFGGNIKMPKRILSLEDDKFKLINGNLENAVYKAQDEDLMLYSVSGIAGRLAEVIEEETRIDPKDQQRYERMVNNWWNTPSYTGMGPVLLQNRAGDAKILISGEESFFPRKLWPGFANYNKENATFGFGEEKHFSMLWDNTTNFKGTVIYLPAESINVLNGKTQRSPRAKEILQKVLGNNYNSFRNALKERTGSSNLELRLDVPENNKNTLALLSLKTNGILGMSIENGQYKQGGPIVTYSAN
jgi:hypothetical protein